MYHKQVLEVSDRVRSKKSNMVSMISPMNLVEMEEDHRQGVRESVRAQACLNETLRLLDKHSELVPQEISAEASRARELGVGQITKMYNLLYGNAGRGSDVAQQMDTLSQRQEEVWLQSTVPQCEQGGKDAKEIRYQARSALANTWAAME
ncbi:hypothetical protein EXIGLDRAFT_410764 [Exidia glandulosa HHB12029]|uniref:Uncharacterized protein n=1 Tax=Exidia glandulosa HHB12029 TaxID=1314781 RepID=A0A165KNI9_EXIGL|nr:hypothetical protein EXIGLDRAFT_410764 [Exidia glandulosa HHB12029]